MPGKKRGREDDEAEEEMEMEGSKRGRDGKEDGGTGRN